MKPALLRHILIAATALAGLAGAPAAMAGTATDVSGLYYTGLNSSGGLQNGGSTDANWAVTYASVGGTNYSGNSTYTGTAYVLSNNYIDAAYVPNSSSSKWITAPGARTTATGGTANVGGDYLPGNGTSGSNTAIYNYTTSFTISGTGSTTVKNKVSISLTIAADDQYAIYVNPTLNSNGSVNTSSSTASAVGYSAWDNTTTVYLQNFSNSNGSDNADFVIGTNKIVIVVTNTNSVTGSSSSSALNPSGLLVYQVGSLATIDGRPVPEVGTWLPPAAALGLFGVMAWRRRRERIQPVQA